MGRRFSCPASIQMLKNLTLGPPPDPNGCPKTEYLGASPQYALIGHAKDNEYDLCHSEPSDF